MLTALLGRGRRSTGVMIVLWAVCFSALCGHTPSVARAAIMITLLQAAPLFNRERDLPTSLGLALMVLLAVNPYAAAHIGLQLSFGAVAGIALVSDGLQSRLMKAFHLDRRPKGRAERLALRVPRFCISAFSATLGASLLTVPLVACYFNTCSLISPVANVMTLWAVGFIFMGGLLAGTAAVLCPAVGQLLALPVGLLVKYVRWAVEVLAIPNLSALSMECWVYRMWLVYVYLLLLGRPGGAGKEEDRRPPVRGCVHFDAVHPGDGDPGQNGGGPDGPERGPGAERGPVSGKPLCPGGLRGRRPGQRGGTWPPTTSRAGA